MHANRNLSAGFTFLEVLIALMIVVLLAYAILQSYLVIFRVNEKAALYQEAGLVLQTVAADHYLGETVTNLLTTARGDWVIETGTREIPSATNGPPLVLKTYAIQPVQGGGVQLDFEAVAPPEEKKP